jgi:hypothetical protein
MEVVTMDLLFNLYGTFFGAPQRFRPGQLVIIAQSDLTKTPQKYMAIERQRWTKPVNEKEWQWVYDGTIYVIEAEKVVYATYGTCFLESSLKTIPSSNNTVIGCIRTY